MKIKKKKIWVFQRARRRKGWYHIWEVVQFCAALGWLRHTIITINMIVYWRFWLGWVWLGPTREVNDKFSWRSVPLGGFTVKMSYDLLKSEIFQDLEVVEKDKSFVRLWNSCILYKVKAFGGKTFLSWLPTKDQLKRRKVLSSSYDHACVLCFQEEDSLEHLFLNCKVAMETWKEVKN